MTLLEFTDRWVVPGLGFLADWSVRWGILLAILLLWLVARPPRRASTRYLMTILVLTSGALLPAVPRWARIAISWPSTATIVARQESPHSTTSTGPADAAADVISTEEPSPRRGAMTATTAGPRPQSAAPTTDVAGRPSLGRWQWTALVIAAAWTSVVLVLTCRLVGGMIVL
ncbi:MAG TPA: hypothetical protein VHS97_07150, partial [Isosphaeraceae bacterium]|nr:hypothetical protein [Isosphaeraceae bacterium]